MSAYNSVNGETASQNDALLTDILQKEWCFEATCNPTGDAKQAALDALFRDQAAELDRKNREALLHTIQQLTQDKAMHIPIWELAFINGQARIAKRATTWIA